MKTSHMLGLVIVVVALILLVNKSQASTVTNTPSINDLMAGLNSDASRPGEIDYNPRVGGLNEAPNLNAYIVPTIQPTTSATPNPVGVSSGPMVTQQPQSPPLLVPYNPVRQVGQDQSGVQSIAAYGAPEKSQDAKDVDTIIQLGGEVLFQNPPPFKAGTATSVDNYGSALGMLQGGGWKVLRDSNSRALGMSRDGNRILLVLNGPKLEIAYGVPPVLLSETNLDGSPRWVSPDNGNKNSGVIQGGLNTNVA